MGFQPNFDHNLIENWSDFDSSAPWVSGAGKSNSDRRRRCQEQEQVEVDGGRAVRTYHAE